MKIAVIGTGYVGLITGLCLSLNHDVSCIDLNPEIIKKINSGIPHIYEKGLKELLAKQLKSGNFRAILINELKLNNIDLVLFCVGTPSLDNGECELKFLKAAVVSLIPLLENIKNSISIIVKSTVPPGTVENIVTSIIRKTYPKEEYPNIAFGMNPEFLREGSAIEDFLNPDRIILGVDSDIAKRHLLNLYDHLDCPKIIVNSSTAEMIKYVNNSLLALQISAANEFSRICEKIPEVDIRDVMNGVLLDNRWQNNKNLNKTPLIHSYLKAGCGFGGSCFPKDVKALSYLANSFNLESSLLKAIIAVNSSQQLNIVKKIACHLKLSSSKILLLGVAFKPDTDDIRDSPTHSFLKHLYTYGSKIYVHDPLVLKKLKSHESSKYLDEDSYVDDFKEIIPVVDAIIIITYWNDYLELPNLLENSKKLIFDNRGVFNSSDFSSCNYLTVGLK